MRHTLLIAAAFVLASAAAAQAAYEDHYLVPYAGVFNVMENGNSDAEGQFGLEYRGSPWWGTDSQSFGIRPVIGANATDSGSFYGYAGLNFDVRLGAGFYLIPNFVAGGYHQGDDNDSEDLGGAIEFRSGLELAYEFDNDWRVGAAFNHISNASIYDRNPGAEAAIVTLGVPLP